MSEKVPKLLNVLSMILVTLTIFTAVLKTLLPVDIDSKSYLINVWVPVVLSLLVYFILSFFIRNPNLLIKKTITDFEHPNQTVNDRLSTQWQKIYYYLRLIVIFFLFVVSLVN